MRFSRLSTEYTTEQLITGLINAFNQVGLNLEDYILVDAKDGAYYQASIFFKFCTLEEAARAAEQFYTMPYLSDRGNGIQVEPSHRGSQMEGYLWRFHK